MPKVEIYHGGEHVANINYPLPLSDVSHALEFAWRWTNNIDGSWSMGEQIPSYFRPGELMDNPDYNPNTEVLVPLPTHMGRTMGLRSSMTGDIFKIDGKAYTVATFGFKDENGNEV